jgi:endoglucanase
MRPHRLRYRHHPLLVAVAAGVAVLTGVAGCATSPADARTGARPTGPFWVDPNSEAAQEAAMNPAFAGIADQPTALTVAGNLGDPVQLTHNAVAQSRDGRQTFILQVYDIPHRDVGGGYSAGGAASDADYLAYTTRLAQALTGVRAVVILEPDSLGQMDQLSASDQSARYAVLSQAVDIYRKVKGVVVYLDGTNSGWTPAPEMARRLLLAGVKRAQGFAVNVSNFYPTAAEADRAEQISALTGAAHYVIDTSRNGGTVIQGHQSSWCNPPDRRLGPTPTTNTGYPHADAYLWVKHPGESDGNCAPGQPPAGQWYPSYARQLIGLTG